MMTAAKKHFSFQLASSSVSDDVLISGGRLFHANRPVTEKLYGRRDRWNRTDHWQDVRSGELV